MPNTLSSLLEKALKEDLDLTVGKRWSHGLKTSFWNHGSWKNEELNLKDKDDDRNHKFLEKIIRILKILMNKEELIYWFVLKGIRNITVLNILIKRNVIEEHHLRFNEDFIYYSDLPFVEGLVMYGNKIAFDEETLYAKRKHNDQLILQLYRKLKMKQNLMNLLMFINMLFL